MAVSEEPKLKHEETEPVTIDNNRTTDEDALEEIVTNVEPSSAKQGNVIHEEIRSTLSLCKY